MTQPERLALAPAQLVIFLPEVEAICTEKRLAFYAGSVKPEYRKHFDPRIPPFAIGDVVTMGLVRKPSDMTQVFRVLQLEYSYYGNGWQAVLGYGRKCPSLPEMLPEETTGCGTFRLCKLEREGTA